VGGLCKGPRHVGVDVGVEGSVFVGGVPVGVWNWSGCLAWP